MGFRFECGEESFFGQTEGWVKCFHQRGPKPVGRLDWALFDNDKYFIQMVEVDREWRRQGVATQMYRELFRDRKISQHDLISTPKTQDGMAFRQNMRLALAPAEAEEGGAKGTKGPSPAYLEFWKEMYDGGKKLVNNPRMREKGKAWKAKVTAGTAMKDPAFQAHVKKEFQAWKDKNKDESKGEPKPRGSSWDKNPNYDRLMRSLSEKGRKIIEEHPFFQDGGVHKALDLCGVGPATDLFGNNPSLNISFREEDKEEDRRAGIVVQLSGAESAAQMLRIIIFDDDGNPEFIENDGFDIKAEKGKGIGTQIFASQVEHAKKAGFKRIECWAQGRPMNGYYTWPVFGYDCVLGTSPNLFDTTKAERERIAKEYKPFLKKMEKQGLPRSIQSLFKIEGGRKWWKENGWDLSQCEFDLSNKSDSVRILEEYQKAKAMTKTSSKKKQKPPKKGWTDAPEIDLSDSQLDKIFQSGKPKSKSKKKASSAHVAQAYMMREAALSEWFQWMAQPVQSILKHHREFVLGPVHDLIDTVIKSIAPTLVKELAEAEVEQDLRDFERGAAAGKADRASGKPASPSRNDTEEFQEGYAFGYENGRAEIPSSMRRSLIEDSLNEFKSEVTIQVMTTLLKKVWHAVNPVNTVKAMIAAVKKHGWKLGVGMALFEIFEHFVLPSILTYLFDDPRLLAMATLPIGEVIYAIVLRVIGRAPKELNKVTEDGHLDWYEQEFGPVRLACLQT